MKSISITNTKRYRTLLFLFLWIFHRRFRIQVQIQIRLLMQQADQIYQLVFLGIQGFESEFRIPVLLCPVFIHHAGEDCGRGNRCVDDGIGTGLNGAADGFVGLAAAGDNRHLREVLPNFPNHICGILSKNLPP